MIVTSTIIAAYITFYGWTGNVAANGKYPYEGSIACPRNIPLGTIVEIDYERFLCTDRYAKWLDKKRNLPTFDIYSNEPRQTLLKWGRRKAKVKIIL